MPKTALAFILRSSGWHQAGLLLLSVLVFILIAVPLDLQRRVVNDAIGERNLDTILLLAVAYAGVAAAEGAIKLILNVYRSWISERAVRQLREGTYEFVSQLPSRHRPAQVNGVEISIILSESEPVGAFVGVALSEPVLQGGLLLSVFGYMVYLQPWMALLSLVVFSPQLVFVPVMQHAINQSAKARIQTLREVGIAIIADPRESGGDPALQRQRIGRVFELNMHIFKLKFSMNFLMNLMHHVGVAVVLALGGWLAVEGRTDVGTVVAFISGIAKVNEPWGEVVNWYRDMTVAQVKYRLIADAVEALASVTGVPLDPRREASFAANGERTTSNLDTIV
ncbi:MAG: ABC transporter ATP-binding protein [Proteobacteria bacterium]|nr:ABC transporter ATP-binding protein [Pseudomonadota bacterium]